MSDTSSVKNHGIDINGMSPLESAGMAVGKEIDMRFVFGYTPLEFRDSLHMLANGKLDAGALITGKVGLGGVVTAFEALKDPETQAKIIIDPRSDATAP